MDKQIIKRREELVDTIDSFLEEKECSLGSEELKVALLTLGFAIRENLIPSFAHTCSSWQANV